MRAKIIKYVRILALLAFAVAVVFAAKTLLTRYSERNMKTLMYLIPDEYFGPVVMVFDQADGIVFEPDPLHPDDAVIVRVPENGIIKIKDKEPPGGAFKNNKLKQYGHASTLMFSVDREGRRKLLPRVWGSYFENDVKDRKKYDVLVYTDSKGEEHHRRVGEFPAGTLAEKMEKAIGDQIGILEHSSCQFRGFYPGEQRPEGMVTPRCGEFFVGRLSLYEKYPKWMFLDFSEESSYKNPGKTLNENGHYESVNELVEIANKRLELKRQFYKLPPWYNTTTPWPPVQPSITSKSNEPCPVTGHWRATAVANSRVWNAQEMQRRPPVYLYKDQPMPVMGANKEEDDEITWVLVKRG